MSAQVLVSAPKSLISVTNERIHQKTFGVKPHRLDPGLTTVGHWQGQLGTGHLRGQSGTGHLREQSGTGECQR